jgi:hypothetical protein
VAAFRAPFYFINLWLISDRHRYCTYLYYSRALPLTLSLSLSRSCSRSLARALSLFLSRPLFLALARSLPFSLALSLSRARSLSSQRTQVLNHIGECWRGSGEAYGESEIVQELPKSISKYLVKHLSGDRCVCCRHTEYTNTHTERERERERERILTLQALSAR